MWKTLLIYIKYLGIGGWILIGLNLFTALGAFEFYTKIPILQNFPIWGWLLLLIIGLLAAPFFAFHKLRKERDKTIQIPNKDALIRAIAEYKSSAIQYIECQDTKEFWRKEAPNIVNTELEQRLSDAKDRFERAREKLDAEVLVARIGNNLKVQYLITFISFQAHLAYMPEPDYSTKDAVNKINKIVNSTIEEIQLIC